MPNRSRKKPVEKDIPDTVVPDAEPPNAKKKAKAKDPAAVALGRKGGLKGGKARAAKMTADERAASAKKAAQARWASRSKAE